MHDNNDHTRPGRRALEVAGWILLVAVLWGTDLLAKLTERDLSVFGKDDFRLISEQVTSAVAVLIMIVFVIHWLVLFPLQRKIWMRAALGHLAGTAIFAFGHHVLMTAMRIAWYAYNQIDYIWREPFVTNLIVEYQKDLKVYLGIVVIVTTYRQFRRAQRGPGTAPRNETLRKDRLIVQTGQGISVLRYDQIDYLEAARNYVAVHAEGREYVIRETLSNLLNRLPGDRFARAHRSYIVNVDKIKEIKAVDSKPHIFLHCGTSVPLSRSFRDSFTASISTDDTPPS